MKKIFAVFLALMMLLGMSIVYADEPVTQLDVESISAFSDSVTINFNKEIDFNSFKEHLMAYSETGTLNFNASTEDNKSIKIIPENPFNLGETYTFMTPTVLDAQGKTFLSGFNFNVLLEKLYEENFNSYTSETFIAQYGNSGIEFDSENKRAKLNLDNNSYRHNVTFPVENNKPVVIKFDAETVANTFSPSNVHLDLGFVGLYGNNATLRYGIYEYAENYETLAGGGMPSDIGSTPTPSTFTFKFDNPVGVGNIAIYHNGNLRKEQANYDFPGNSTTDTSFTTIFALANTSCYTYLDNIMAYSPNITSNYTKATLEELTDIKLTVDSFLPGGTVTCNFSGNTTGTQVFYDWYESKNDNEYPMTNDDWVLKQENDTSNQYTIINDNRYIKCVVKQKVNGVLIKQYESPVIFKAVPPMITASEIKKKDDNTLVVEYVYADANADLEKDTQIIWYTSANKTDWTQIKSTTVSDGDTAKDIEADVTDLTDLFVKCVITPKSEFSIGATESEYTGASVEAAYTLPFKPIAKTVTITGGTAVGSVLVADYDYYDENSDAENETATQKIWYRVSGSGKTKVGTGLTYSLQNADAGNKIVFEVTPKNDVLPENTTAFPSNEISVSGGTYIGGSSGGGSSSSSSGSSYSSKSEVKAENEEKESNFVYIPEPEPEILRDVVGHWAYDSIKELNKKGLINGRGNGFEPDSFITRAEWLTLLYRGIGLDDLKVTYRPTFSDVKQDEWYTNVILDAYSKKFVNGDNGVFNPNGNITREQMAKMLIEVLEYQTEKDAVSSEETAFSDNEIISDWAGEYINKAVGEKLMTGTPEGKFEPLKNATRAEAATVLLRFINLIGQEG